MRVAESGDVPGAAFDEPARVRVREIVREDGLRERFDPSRLAASLHRAAASVGQGELLLAEELATLVALVLEEEHAGGCPSTRAVRETAERVLMETGHHEVARSYILLQSRRPGARARAAAAQAEGAAPRIAALGRECLEPFDAARISGPLLVECGMAQVEAAAVAGAVEQRVRALGEEVLPASLVRHLLHAELLDRGHRDALARLRLIGLPLDDVEAIAGARAGGERADMRLGGELLRRYSLARLLDPPVTERHLEGDLHVDGLHAPGRALRAALDLSRARRAEAPGVLAAVLHLVHALEPALVESLEIGFLERALAPARSSAAAAVSAAETLLLALSDGPESARGRGGRLVLAVGADLTPAAATATFRRGGEPGALRERLRWLILALLERAVRFAPHLELPRIRVLLDPGEEEAQLAPLAAALQPALALGLADVETTPAGAPAVRVTGARVGLNVARQGLRAGRRRERELLRALAELLERGLEAGANVLRHLLQRDEQGVGFRHRLRAAVRAVGRDLPLDLPGSPVYEIALVPVGLDAAVRAVTERDPSESEAAAELRDEALAVLRAKLPRTASESARFVLAREPFARAQSRFGRLDWLAFPRGRDVLGLVHDGAAFDYSCDESPRAMAMAAHVTGSSARTERPPAGVEDP
jgi:hypothetical protein